MSQLSLAEMDILPLAVRLSSRLYVEAMIHPLLTKAGEALIQLFFYNSVFRQSWSKCQTISTHLVHFLLQTELPLLSFHFSKVP